MAQTQRIARSYLTDMLFNKLEDQAAAEDLAIHLMGEAATVDYQPRRDRLVLTFDLAEQADDEKPVPYVPADTVPMHPAVEL